MDKIENTLSVAVTKDDTYEYPLHLHAHWEIMSYQRGTGVMKTKSGDISFSPGTVICIPPSFLHGSKSENGFKNISLGSPLFSFPSDKPIVFEKESSAELSSLISSVYSLYYRDGHKYASAIEKIIYAINDFIPSLMTTDAIYLGSVVEKVKEQIVKSFTDCYFSLSAFIKTLPYTDDYIRSCFKKATGITPLQYLTDMRLNHASIMLKRNPSEKITTVALASGFSDPLYFSRAYKRKYGFSPAKYKEIETK